MGRGKYVTRPLLAACHHLPSAITYVREASTLQSSISSLWEQMVQVGCSHQKLPSY